MKRQYYNIIEVKPKNKKSLLSAAQIAAQKRPEHKKTLEERKVLILTFDPGFSQ